MDAESVKHITARLDERIALHNASKAAVQAELEETVRMLKAQLDRLQEKLSKALTEAFEAEDERLERLSRAISAGPGGASSSFAEAAEDAQAELLVQQTYTLEEHTSAKDLTELYRLKVVKNFCGVEARRPEELRVVSDIARCVNVACFRFLTAKEKRVVERCGLGDAASSSIAYRAALHEKSSGNDSNSNGDDEVFLLNGACAPTEGDEESHDLAVFLDAGKTYTVRVRAECCGRCSAWSEPADFVPGFAECCVWRRCPGSVDRDRLYAVCRETPRVAVKTTEGGYCWSTVVGNTTLPPGRVTSWSVRILKSRCNDGGGMFVGVAPFGIDQNVGNNSEASGWYFDCYRSRLSSESLPGPWRDAYGPSLGPGQYVRTGDAVGVVMDTARGELSFVVNGVSFGVAYDGIPLDKPLVPCVLLKNKGDSVELDTTEVRETKVSAGTVAVPFNVSQTSASWDSVTLFWGVVAGAAFYQVEVDGTGAWAASATNNYTKRGLLPGTEHAFRVRAVRGGEASEWSAPVQAETQEAPPFEACTWRQPPDRMDDWKAYSVRDRAATKLSEDGAMCMVLGTAGLPFCEVSSWNVRVLRSRGGDASGVYVGVAPSDADVDSALSPLERGWFLNCYYSTLRSGPPHGYKWKDYGHRKEKGKYVRTDDAVGVVMDMENDTLSFVLGGVNLGVAYDGIPLDKPLVPAVVLENKDDTVELVVYCGKQQQQQQQQQQRESSNGFFSFFFSKISPK